MKAWVETAAAEVNAMFALLLLWSLQSKPRQKALWAWDPLDNRLAFPQTMTRDRFETLTSRPHVVDHDGVEPVNDHLWKLQPVIDLSHHFSSVYTPPRRMSVDESLWKLLGHWQHIDYMPDKHVRFRVKVYKYEVSEGKMS